MFDKVLIANRGAIAVRIERTLKKMNIKSVAVYSKEDRDSLHVSCADEAYYLGEGSAKDTYLNMDKIIEACVKSGAQAVHPGYGFLSENTDFALKASEHGIKFIGPTTEQIKQFGLKVPARELANKANVPLLPGTGLLKNIDEAVNEASIIGYPIMLKSTAGGGGIGIRICQNESELRDCYDNVVHLSEANFNDGGVFIEKYIPRARHIEVQIFGNEYGEVTAIGERDCSVQRRNQKVVEESPAPNLSDVTRQKMYLSAENLAKEAGYRNAGTVEFLYDEFTDSYYFLEVNTRLQVEHGITEEVMGVDLVEWMVLEAAGELRDLKSKVGLPNGHSIECRVYAEDCLNNFRPSAGKIDDIFFSTEARVETWIKKNIEVTALYDPMLAKLIVHGDDREDAIRKMNQVLSESKIYGITSNIQYLGALLKNKEYKEGRLFTKMLENFSPSEDAIEVLDGGVQTTVQDVPGMLGYWTVGVPPCGAMDDYHFRLGNTILDNPEDAAGLEMTLKGGKYKFRSRTTICITGADMSAKLNGELVDMNEAITVEQGDVLSLGMCSQGMRTYLTVKGGFDVPKTMGSSSTFIDGKFGGHNGRILRSGDVLKLLPEHVTDGVSFDKNILSEFTNEWTIGVIPGPQPTGEYLKPEFLDTLTNSEYTVSYNSARTGIRLNGPIPEWVREDGGEAGLHPSNIHDNAYAVGTLDLTGDQPILLGPDGPSLGGFVCPVTTAKAEMWKLGQLHPGDRVRFALVGMEQARELLVRQREIVKLNPVKEMTVVSEDLSPEYAIITLGKVAETEYIVRRDGQENILLEFGKMELNIELRFRVHILMEELKKSHLPIIDMTPGIRSLQVHFDINIITMDELVRQVLMVNDQILDIDNITVPSRIVYLPLSWDDPQTQLAARRYQETTRPDAPWCPSNPEFIRRINGLDSIDDVKDIVFKADYLVLGLGDVYLGAPVATPVDPRHRMVTTKYNPARPWTPENAVGIGGAYLCVYGMEGPGGYQFVGRTIQMWNSLMETKFFTKEEPWLLRFFDQIRFYPVSAEEILEYRDKFLRGQFDIKIEESSFNLGEYRKYLDSIKDSAREFKEHQEAAFEAERQMWKEKGLDHFVSEEEEKSSYDAVLIPEGSEAITANIPGSIWKVMVKPGDIVKEGDIVIIMESMKMEFPVESPKDGRVVTLYSNPGDKVESGAILAAIE